MSLVPTLRGHRQSIPPAYLETYQPWLSYGWAPLKSLRQGTWKLIAAVREEIPSGIKTEFLGSKPVGYIN